MCFRFLRTLLCDHYRELKRYCRCQQIVDIEQLRYCSECQKVADSLDPKEAAEYRKKRVHEIALELGWEEVRRLYLEQVDRDKRAGVQRLPYEENLVFPIKGDLRLVEEESEETQRNKEELKHHKNQAEQFRQEAIQREKEFYARKVEEETMTDIIWEKEQRKLTAEEKKELRRRDTLKRAAIKQQRRKEMKALEKLEREKVSNLRKKTSLNWLLDIS